MKLSDVLDGDEIDRMTLDYHPSCKKDVDKTNFTNSNLDFYCKFEKIINGHIYIIGKYKNHYFYIHKCYNYTFISDSVNFVKIVFYNGDIKQILTDLRSVPFEYDCCPIFPRENHKETLDWFDGTSVSDFGTFLKSLN